MPLGNRKRHGKTVILVNVRENIYDERFSQIRRKTSNISMRTMEATDRRDDGNFTKCFNWE